MFKNIMLSFCLLSLALPSFSAGTFHTDRDTLKNVDSDTLNIDFIIEEDDPVLVAMDEMWKQEQLQWQSFSSDTLCLNAYGFAKDEIPEYPDSIYAQRLAVLNAATPMNLDYNKYVAGFIDLYVNRRRGVTSRALGLAELYYPMFEEMLDQFDIPLELKHLAVVESALNPTAKSRVGASGLWQFMYRTGKIYDLEVTSYVDDRSDPYKSTVAACRYMQFLYGMYGDWNLVLAAYNSGPGNVNKAIRRSGGHKDYWKIRPYLPRETRGYVPAFIAVNYAMNYSSEHNLYPVVPTFLHSELDTIQVCREITFDQITAFTNVGTAELEFLNPSFKRNIIPQRAECYTLTLPSSAVGVFLANEDSLYNFVPESPQAVDGYVVEETLTTYTVKSGDVLGLIAQRQGVGVSQLREWNNIRGNRIYPGQKLEIRKSVKTKVGETTAQAEPKPANSGTNSDVKTDDAGYHIIQKGDTLWDIAKIYPGISVNDIKVANTNLSDKNLKPGQKIKIPNKS
jgi:membrane-bound lytic murein transglycosylase D